MKNLYLFLLFLVMNGLSAYSQQNIAPGELLQENKEEVFVHYNSTFLLAGETLFYKLYCVNGDTGKLTNLSKIGYLELTGPAGQRIFLHKVDLDKGVGYGDFLIPSTVPSGSYKLLGYTRWMQNGGTDNFFKGDLVIINPYMENQNEILLSDGERQDELQQDSQADLSKNNLQNNHKSYRMTSNGETFGKREKVKITIDKLNRNLASGNFSLSVKKMEEFKVPEVLNSDTYLSKNPTGNWNSGSRTILPDLRGQVISGKLVAGDAGLDVSERSIVFSLPGRQFFVRIAKTSSDGTFRFNLENRNLGSLAYLQVLGDNMDNFQIILDEDVQVTKEGLEFNKFEVSPAMIEHIKKRSIYNQVENSFIAVKQDSLVPESTFIPFYGTLPEVYELDAFTRFPTLQETFLEIIQFARIRKNRDGNSHIELVSTTGAQGHTPLLIVDGLIVQDHDKFVHYDAAKIKKIGLQREDYYLGPEVFKGLIVVETIEGDFFNGINSSYLKTESIQNLQPQKEYFQPHYNIGNNTNSRVPDYRLQLLWFPEIELNESGANVEFFTSDVPGNYKISLEGFTEDGEAISLYKMINVQ